MLYYGLVLALNLYCFYHAYKNGNSYYWFFIIFFLPVFGSIIYLLFNVINFGSVQSAQEEAFKVLYPSKQIKDLEKKLDFVDTFENRVALADAYLQHKRYEEAIDLYLSVLKGTYENDYYVITNLISAYFKTEQYDYVIAYVDKIKHKTEYKFSVTRFKYAKSLEYKGNLQGAEEELRQLDIPYKNYEARYYLASFLLKKGNNEEAKAILKELITEYNHMQRSNKRKYSGIFKLIKETYSASSS